MAEFRPLRLKDLKAAYRLTKSGGLADPVFARVHRLSPIGLAVFSLLPGTGGGAYTFVSRENDASYGLVQVRKRWDGSNADLMFISPGIEEEEDCRKWKDLLDGTARELKERGTIKLYARVPSDGPERKAFLDASFQMYAEETLLWIPPRFDLPEPSREPEGVYLGCSRAYLHLLYTRVTPQMVQRWESMPEQYGPPGWDCFRGHVIMWLGKDGTPLGAIYVEQGARGTLLQGLLIEPPPDGSRDFLLKGISLLWNRITPCFALVRSYQQGLKSLLLEIGFEEMSNFTAAVRNIAIPEMVKSPAGKRVEAGNGVVAGLTPTRIEMNLHDKR